MTAAENGDLSRRQFVKRTGMMAGAALVGAQVRQENQAAAPAAQESASTGSASLPHRTLGRTAVPISLFTMGTAPCGGLPPKQIADLVNVALEEGVTAIDTSEKYNNSQEGVGLALGKRRKDVFLSTKVFANSIEEAERSLADSMRLLKTDYFDVLYYHSLGNLQIERAMEPDGVFTWLVKQKKAGKCRFLGVSGHNLPGRFAQFLESGEVDVLLAAVNFVDRHTYNFEERVLPVARKHNIGVVAMKVFGGAEGMKYNEPTRSQLDPKLVPLAVRYALSLPGVTSANLGVHTAEQIRHNARMVGNLKPLSEQERNRLDRLGRSLAAQWGEHFGPVRETENA